MTFWHLYGEAAKTAIGFFWKAGWAFILGYWVSAMIQAFIPKGRLTPYMGKADLKSVALATIFGTASSSCSFAALATARSLILKGAHFVAAVAFMFASTNLVIELGILILIFLGWQFLAAEIIGGILLIGISTLLIKYTYPEALLKDARKRVADQDNAEDNDFDWKDRIRSVQGWNIVGHRFVSDWKMVWEEITIGFTVAGFVAVLVTPRVWEAIFLIGMENTLPNWLIVIENAVVAPFVAAATFIGSMGNIPLATVLNANGIYFAGIMSFIYSDLMVPPLVMVNAKYYGWRIAIYIAGIMFVSIIITALLLHYLFVTLGITPESNREIGEITQFAFDYTFYLNIVFGVVAAIMIWFDRRYKRDEGSKMKHKMVKGLGTKRVVAIAAFIILVTGFVIYLINNLA